MNDLFPHETPVLFLWLTLSHQMYDSGDATV